MINPSSPLASVVGLSLLLMSSCFSAPTHNTENYTSLELVEIDTLRLFLDDSTTQIATYLHPFFEEDSFQIVYLNNSAGNICFFDITSSQELTPIHISREGPSAVDLPNVKGISHISKDTTVLYEYWSGTFSYVDHAGEVFRRDTIINPSNEQENMIYMPFASTSAPLTKYRDGWLMVNQPSGEIKNNHPVYTLAYYDNNGVLLKRFSDYPDVYGEPTPLRWNFFLYLIPSFTIDTKENIIVSFPASDSIRVYDRDFNYNSYFAGFSEAKRINPSKNAMTDQTHLFKSFCYTSILHDPWHNLYYRIIARPTEQENPNPVPGQALPRPIAIVVLDNTFHKVGEFNIDNYSGSYSQAFVSPQGLHIHSYSDNDDILTFRTFTPKA